jgi:hypothetical protein
MRPRFAYKIAVQRGFSVRKNKFFIFQGLFFFAIGLMNLFCPDVDRFAHYDEFVRARAGREDRVVVRAADGDDFQKAVCARVLD